MEILVAYEARRGHARDAADACAHVLASHRIATIVRRADSIDGVDLGAVDAMIAGCWTPGNVPFGGEPTERMARWIDGLPDLDGLPIAVYCTYSFFPHTFADTAARTAETLDWISSRFELKGWEGRRHPIDVHEVAGRGCVGPGRRAPALSPLSGRHDTQGRTTTVVPTSAHSYNAAACPGL